MDLRYKEDEIFHRRKTEWDLEKIRKNIETLFSNVSLIPDWKFLSSEWLKENTKRSEELKRHLYKTLKITVEDHNKKKQEFNIQLPILVQDQFFYIGGFLKIPIFQLFDYPVIHKHTSDITIRTNTITAGMHIKDNGSLICTVFNKQMPLSSLLAGYCNSLELITFTNSLETEFPENPRMENIKKVLTDCQTIWAEKDETTILSDIGEYFSAGGNIDKYKKGKNTLFSLKSAYIVDHYSKQFLKTDNILFEFIYAYIEGPRSDTNVSTKRLRYSEYILAPLIKKVYEMIYTIFSNKKSKFQIPKNIIIEKCNVSDIIHYNFIVNPVGEIASLLQCTLIGPGGFKKENVPIHLRNLDDSQFGRICPADTPDREGCGVILNLIPTVKIDEAGRFLEASENVVTSYPISLTPFLKNDDQTRLQMASNQSKQAILVQGEQPWVRSGTEECYLDHGTFFHVAKDDGSVIHSDSSFMIVKYDNLKEKNIDIFKIKYRDLYLSTLDYIEPKFKETDKFKKGDVLCESKFIKNGEIALGKNLLTGICIWKGFNYEDGIVISQKVADEKFTSVHSVDLSFSVDPSQVLLSLDETEYKPFPEIGTKLKKGDTYAKIKTIEDDEGLGLESINLEPIELKAPLDCTITKIEFYPNEWNKVIPEYYNQLELEMKKQTNAFLTMQSKLKGHMNKEEVDAFITVHGLSRLDCTSRKGKYSINQKRINGIMIKLEAVYDEQISIGDKVANRHGNKGVIAQIIPNDQMPSLEDGRKLEIIINPLGIISRMNCGQLMELTLNETLHSLRKILSDIYKEDNKLDNVLLKLTEYLDIFDKTVDKHNKEFILKKFKMRSKKSVQKAIDELCLYCTPFEDLTPIELDELVKLTKSEYKHKVFDPASQTYLKNKIECGYLYFLKLVHRSSDKLSSRSIGPYSRKTLQPLGGKKRMGGHKLGEMEVWALLSHNATNFLHDFLTVHSDSPGMKNELLAKILENPSLVESDKSDRVPQSLRLLSAYLAVLGIQIRDENPITNINVEEPKTNDNRE